MLLTRYGIRECLVATVAAGVAGAVSVWLGWWWSAAAVGGLWLAVMSFFRDPPRRVPTKHPAGGEVMLSPADGRVTAIERGDHHPAVSGPAVVIRIFLSILNVHVNRVPTDGRVLAVEHRPGRHHDARSPASCAENESTLVTIRLRHGETIGVRQIAGKVARRIVCDLKPDDRVRRGHRFGMIKFGSSAELILPRPELVAVHARVGDRVRGGLTALASLGSDEGEESHEVTE
ncbi:MAG: phosphatidylserine decarboxylase [Planctomycetota bacterium]|jgi:phosphatidylserine decarboxylase